EARKGLQLLRRHLEHPERLSGLQPLEASLERGALEVAGALFLLEPLVTPLGLLEVGEHQFRRDRLDRGSKRDLISRELRNDEQQRVEIANQRNEAQVERRAFLLFLGIGREVEHRQLRGDEFLRVMGRREEIEPRIGNLDLPQPRAIFLVALPRQRRKAGQRVKYSRLA